MTWKNNVNILEEKIWRWKPLTRKLLAQLGKKHVPKEQGPKKQKLIILQKLR